MKNDVLFQHRASVKGYGDGILLVNQWKIEWEKLEPNDDKSSPSSSWCCLWVTIGKITYTAPPHAMMRIKPLIDNESEKVITLTGASKLSCREELEKLKLLENEIKRNESEVKKKLLEQNVELKNIFEELVVKKKVIGEDGFWLSHANQLMDMMSNISLKRGKQNFILMDAIQMNSNGSYKLNLTPEIKQDLFRLYPSVKRAYEAEVPMKCNEKDFWISYIQSIDNQTRNNILSGIKRYNDVFSRYVEDNDAKISSNFEKNKKISNMVDTTIDLTSSYEDYHSVIHMVERQEQRATVDDKQSSSSFSISHAYNKNNLIIMSKIQSDHTYQGEDNRNSGDPSSANSSSNSSGGDSRTVGRSISFTLDELYEVKPREYLPIMMKETSSLITSPHESDLKDYIIPESNAFGVSNKRVRKNITERTNEMMKKTFQMPSAYELFIEKIRKTTFPSFEKGNKLYQQERLKMKSYNMTSFERISNDLSQFNSTTEHKYQYIPVSFQQEMLEIFTTVTELLRHFYILTHRYLVYYDTADAHQHDILIPANVLEKTSNVVNHLQLIGNKLIERKDQIHNQRFHQKSMLNHIIIDDEVDPLTSELEIEACTSIIKDVLMLIQRAKATNETLHQNAKLHPAP